MSEQEAIKAAIQVINEVGKIDPGVGGIPQIFKISKDKIEGHNLDKIIKILKEANSVQTYVEDIWSEYLVGGVEIKDGKIKGWKRGREIKKNQKRSKSPGNKIKLLNLECLVLLKQYNRPFQVLALQPYLL